MRKIIKKLIIKNFKLRYVECSKISDKNFCFYFARHISGGPQKKNVTIKFRKAIKETFIFRMDIFSFPKICFIIQEAGL